MHKVWEQTSKMIKLFTIILTLTLITLTIVFSMKSLENGVQQITNIKCCGDIDTYCTDAYYDSKKDVCVLTMCPPGYNCVYPPINNNTITIIL